MAFLCSPRIPCRVNPGGKVNPAVKPLRMTTFSCFLFQCPDRTVNIIPKAADDMETVLTHRRYEVSLEKNASATTVLDMLCSLSFL